MGNLYEVPLDTDDANFQIRTDLDGTQYVLRFRWNTRAEKWIFSILDSGENPLAMGLKLNVNANLINAFNANEDFPQGPLFLWDKQNLGAEATRENLGSDYVLYYGGN